MYQPLLSVVIPLYNKREAITKTLLSVANQTYQNWECLVVDDGSTDSSGLCVKTFLSDRRFVYLFKENGGVSSARNLGVEKANGDYIVFLDADDYLLPCALNSLISVCQRYGTHCGVGRICGEVRGELRRSFTWQKKGIIDNNFRAWALGKMSPRTGAAIFKKEVLLRHPNRVDLSRYEDAESLCNILREETFAYTPDFVFVYCSEYASLSRKLNFERDFCKCLQFEGKSFWEKVLLGGILNDGICCYGREKMNTLYKPYMRYTKIAQIIGKMRYYPNRMVRALEKCRIIRSII